MKGIIIYQGRYGATAQYARWLADALRLPMFGAEEATPALLAGYDLVILGSSVYVGKLLIAKWLDRNAGLLADKKVFLFVVCGTTADDPVLQQALIAGNLGRSISKSVTIFFLPGRCVVSKLSWKDRLLLKMGAWLEKDLQKKAVMKQGFNRLDGQNLTGLITAVKEASLC